MREGMPGEFFSPQTEKPRAVKKNMDRMKSVIAGAALALGVGEVLKPRPSEHDVAILSNVRTEKQHDKLTPSSFFIAEAGDEGVERSSTEDATQVAQEKPIEHEPIALERPEEDRGDTVARFRERLKEIVRIRNNADQIAWLQGLLTDATDGPCATVSFEECRSIFSEITALADVDADGKQELLRTYFNRQLMKINSPSDYAILLEDARTASYNFTINDIADTLQRSIFREGREQDPFDQQRLELFCELMRKSAKTADDFLRIAVWEQKFPQQVRENPYRMAAERATTMNEIKKVWEAMRFTDDSLQDPVAKKTLFLKAALVANSDASSAFAYGEMLYGDGRLNEALTSYQKARASAVTEERIALLPDITFSLDELGNGVEAQHTLSMLREAMERMFLEGMQTTDRERRRWITQQLNSVRSDFKFFPMSRMNDHNVSLAAEILAEDVRTKCKELDVLSVHKEEEK